MSQHHHRPTLKQSNKKYKPSGGHSSKGSLRDAAKGRIARTAPKSGSRGQKTAAQTKAERRNTAKQVQKQKRAELVQGARVFEGRNGAPRIVLVLLLTEDVSGAALAKGLAEAAGEEWDQMDQQGVRSLRVSRFSQSLQLLLPPFPSSAPSPSAAFHAILDAAKIADYIIPILSATTEVSAWGETILRCVQAQGCGEVVSVVEGLNNVDSKSRTATRASLLSFIRYFFPSQSKLACLSQPSEMANALRSICTGFPKAPSWREGRTYLVGEDLEWDKVEGLEGGLVLGGEDGEKGTLKVTGVVRGEALNPNRLVHLQNFGDFQLSQITPAPLSTSSRAPQNSMSVDASSASTVLAAPAAEDQDDLVSENDPDLLANEQTWPTEEEMAEAPAAQANGKGKGVVRRVPKGTSSYQAAWIVDDADEDEESEGDEDEEDEEGMEEDGEEDGEEGEGEFEETEEVEVESRAGEAFEDLDPEEEEKQLQAYLAEAKEDEAFPDEVDTPQHIPARERFARYRGLKSFRTSPWDPYENLPLDMGRIFEFEDYAGMSRRVLRRACEGGEEGDVQAGTRVTLHIKGVPKAVLDSRDRNLPFLVFGLLQHEKKKSVLNMVIQRNTEYDGVVKSKDPLTLLFGPRRLDVRPLYSQHLQGGKTVNNVHKFERFLRHGDAHVATIFGPVGWGRLPVLLLRDMGESEPPSLVATGSLMNADPTRIIAKRIILSGAPIKVHRKTSTIRYMFFNPEDVMYYKPLELRTKMGRVGHIVESLGQHGYFKAHFDGPITQMDTILLNLYKRCFPKFASLHRISAAPASRQDGAEMEE